VSAPLSILWSQGPYDRLTVTAHAAGSSQLQDIHRSDWRAVMNKVARFADVGGACGPTAHRADAAMAILSAMSSDPSELRCEFEIKELSSFVARALASALEFFSAKVVPLTRTAIYADAGMHPAAWPRVSGFVGSLPFSVHDDRVQFTSGFDIEVRLGAPPSQQAANIVEDAFGHWVSAVNVGCFATQGVPPAQCYAYPGDDTLLEGNTLRLSLERTLFAEPEGIDSLLSIFQCVHERGTVIEHVDFYE
jgi:hypothetical protein